MNRRLLSLVAIVVLMAAACGADRDALVVGDETVSRADLLDALDEQGELVDGMAPVDAAAVYLSQRAQELTIQNAADTAGLDVVVDETNSQEVLTDLVATEIESRVPDVAVMVASSSVCSRHILVETREEADDVLAQIESGADFAGLANELSLDPGSGAAGGDLGCQPPGTFVVEFEAALIDADANEVVGPVETEFGFHLIERLPSPEADSPAIVDAGLGSAFESQEEFDGWFEEMLSLDDVTVDSRYGTWDSETLRVVPPAQPATSE